MHKKYDPPRTIAIELHGIRDTMVVFSQGSSITDGSGDIEVGAKEDASFHYDCWHDDEDEPDDSRNSY